MLNSTVCPPNEVERLRVLNEFHILDTPPEEKFDDLTRLTSQICEAPFAVISLVESHRQWFKSKVGVTVQESIRNGAFCAHTILQSDLFIVPDALADSRFADNPFVTQPPHIRFYAGAPLLTTEGYTLGSLCILDCVPRELTEKQMEALRILSRQVVAQLELRRIGLKRETVRVPSLAQLEEDEKNISLLMESTGEGIYGLDLEGHCTFCNPACLRILGYQDRHELYGKNMHALIHHTNQDGSASPVKECKVSQSFQIGLGIHADDEILWRKDGTSFQAEYWSYPVRRDGVLVGSVVTFVDITERKQAEKNLQASEMYFRTLVENAPFCIHELDLQGKFLGVNPAGLKMVNLEREAQLIGTSYLEGVAVEDRARVQALLSNACSGHSPEFEFKSAREVPPKIFASNFIPIRNSENRIDTIMGFSQDMTDHKQAETDLKQQRNFLRHVIDIIPNFVFAKDRAGRFTLANQAVAKAYGTTVEELLGKSDADFNSNSTEVEFFRQKDLKVLDSLKDEFIPEEVITDSKGKSRWFQTVKRPLIGEEGTAYAVLGVATDITGRKQAEAELLERNHMLALDAEVGHVLSQNQELQVLLQGCTEALVRHLNGTFARIWTLNTTEQILELQASAGLYTHLNGLHARVPVGQLKIGKIASEKKPHLTNAVIGDPRVSEQEWAKQQGLVAFAGYPLLRNEEIVGVMAMFSQHPLTDFTLNSLEMVADRITTAIEREIANEAYLKSARHSEQILASAGEGIYGLDLECNVTFVNPAGAKILGYQAEELIGLSVHTAVHYPHSEVSDHLNEMCPMCATLKNGTVHHVDSQALWRKDATSFPAEYTSTPILEDGRLTGAVVTFQDITERKRAEAAYQEKDRELQQAQKMETIGTLAAGIAHDFNNILSGIFGFTEMALRTIPDNEQLHTYLAQVLTAASRAKDLVKQILAFSRNVEIEQRPTDPHLLLKEVVNFLRATLPSSIEIKEDIAQNLGIINADPTQIYQVITNLCANAEFAMRETGGILEIRLEMIEVGKDLHTMHPQLQLGSPHLCLTIRDTGQGMSSDTQKRIFDPFFTTKAVGEGAGMGLSVVHGIIASHGGVITVQSHLGQGTSFTIYLPDIATDDIPPIQVDIPIEKGRGKVLLVEDEEALADLGRLMIEQLGYTVEVHTSSLSALESFKSSPQKFDVVLSDQTMPTLTGEGLARELLEVRSDLPIILCTGYSHTMTQEKAQAMGVRAFLMKPFYMRELATTLQGVMDQYPEQQE